jgi:predicted amino acid racemase
MGEEPAEFYGSILSFTIETRYWPTQLPAGIIHPDKLIQLSLYKQLIEAKFNIKIPWVSGNFCSDTIDAENARPMAVNHFRVGEAPFFW